MTKEQEILDFINKEWGIRKLDRIGLKLGEEAGEVQAAIHKLDEDRSTLTDLDDEVGDVLIVLSQIAALRKTTLEDLRDRRFKMIKERAMNK
jgi:NTP pyrophosphatase (non-canonical NTP hydrolase)